MNTLEPEPAATTTDADGNLKIRFPAMAAGRELNSLEPFDLILLVVVGDLVQQGVTQNDESLTGARRGRRRPPETLRTLIEARQASLLAEARLEGISSIEDLRWAILETSGRISFVEKSD